MTTTTATHYLAIDIEATGDSLFNTVNAIGVVVGPVMGAPRDALTRFRVNLRPLPGDTDDPLCMREFWSKNAAVWQEIQATAVDAREAMLRLLAFCLQMVAVIEDDPAVGGRIEILSDCADFDLGRLQYLGEAATKTWPGGIRTLGKPGTRRSLSDPTERIGALKLWDAWKEWKARNVPGIVHDHRPDNDAEYMYYQMVFLQRKGKDL